MTAAIKPLQGWIFNHAQQSEDDEGVWEIGYLDPEDGGFFEIITVDTGNYYQPQAAEPIARAVLAMLAAKPDIDAAAAPPQVPQPAEPVAEVGDLVFDVRARAMKAGMFNRDPLYAAPPQVPQPVEPAAALGPYVNVRVRRDA